MSGKGLLGGELKSGGGHELQSPSCLLIVEERTRFQKQIPTSFYVFICLCFSCGFYVFEVDLWERLCKARITHSYS